MTYYELDPRFTDPKRVKKEREKAQKLKQSPWWKNQIAQGICHYCGNKFAPQELTLDHKVPVARGGESNKANIVPSCRPCNQAKGLDTPADQLLRKLGSAE